MPVTEIAIKVAIRNAKSNDKVIKLSAGGGLFLLIKPNGSTWWRLQYRMSGKQKLISVGVYPDVGLKDARERRDEARKLLAAGIDPSENRKAIKAAKAEENGNTFEVIAREWLGKQSETWTSSHLEKITRRLEKDIFPWLGKRPITDITAKELRGVLKRIEDRGVRETTHRALQNCGQVFRHAIVTGRAKYDISRDLEGSLLPMVKSHFAAITEPKAVGELLRASKDYSGSAITRYALQLAPLVFLRPGELRHAEWKEFDLDKSEWNVPAARMKIKKQGNHLVPLSRQALAILEEIKPLTGGGRYVFPSVRTNQRPMSENTVLAALRRMGFTKEEMTGHGFRAMARTILDEVLNVRPDFIEHQLAHAVRDPNGRAYNRTAHLDARRKMMQDWADYLDTLAAGGEVLPFPNKSVA
jgi:integrase